MDLGQRWLNQLPPLTSHFGGWVANGLRDFSFLCSVLFRVSLPTLPPPNPFQKGIKLNQDETKSLYMWLRYLVPLGTAPTAAGLKQTGSGAGRRVGRVGRAGHRGRRAGPLGLAVVLRL